jgi:polysaccharide biosynthesis protein PslF
MKILVISAAFPPVKAGEADHAFHLCRRLAARGLDVHVLTTKRNIQLSGLPFKLYPIMPHWLWPDLPRFAKFLTECAPDAVLLIYSDRDYNCHPMITLAPSLAKVLLPSVPFVTQLETEYISRKTSLPTKVVLKLVSGLGGRHHFDYIFGTLLSKSDRFIVLSERHLYALLNSFPFLSGRGMVISPPPLVNICEDKDGIARCRGRKTLGIESEDFVIAYYGYLYAEKGIETLFAAFQILSSQRKNVRLLMIGGSGPESQNSSYINAIHDLAKQLQIQAKLTWTGEYHSDSDEASFYLRTADVCVFPFKYGVTLNRSSVAVAAAHGLPIITTKGHSLESAFLDRVNLLLCPPDDPHALAWTIGLVIGDRALHHRLHVGALKLAEEYFCWDKAVERTVQALAS